jgi:GNAT superfamily N-acetyltransferase
MSIPFSIQTISIPSIPSHLILPSALSTLKEFSEQEGYLVAYGAFSNQEMVGCAIAQVYFLNQSAELLSLVVKEEWRKQSIGSTLFQEIENNLKQNQVRALGFEFEKNDPFAKAIEQILAHQCWLPPKLYLLRCHFEADNFHPPWMHIRHRLPPNFAFFNWQELKTAEKELLLYKLEQGHFLPNLSPFKNEKAIHWETSTGLRYLDKVIGWCITHVVDEQTIRYDTLYVDHEFLHLGYGIFLLNEAFRKHRPLPISKAIFEANMEQIDRSWFQFIKKRLVPLSYHTERLKWAYNSYV